MNRQREIEKLALGAAFAQAVQAETAKAELLAAAIRAADMLDNMTTADYRLGKDRPVREALRRAIAKAGG